MADVQYQQTDTTAPCPPAAYCSGIGLAGLPPLVTPWALRAPSVPGVAARFVLNFTRFTVSTLFYQITPNWPAIVPVVGDWVVRFNVTQVPQFNHLWKQTFICHVNASTCLNVALLGVSSPNKQIVLGVNSDTVVGVALPATFTPADGLFVVITSQLLGGFRIDYVDDQLIDSPYGLPVPHRTDIRHYVASASGSYGLVP